MIVGGSSAAERRRHRRPATGKPNVIASDAVARGDIRTLSPEQESRVRREDARHRRRATSTRPLLDRLLRRRLPADGADRGQQGAAGRLNQVNATLGLPEMPPGDPANRGAGDISFVAFIDGLVGLGMAGEGSHAPGETADLRSLDVQAKRAALLMSRLAKEPPPESSRAQSKRLSERHAIGARAR
jgi:glutamate carboxypeptidase